MINLKSKIGALFDPGIFSYPKTFYVNPDLSDEVIFFKSSKYIPYGSVFVDPESLYDAVYIIQLNSNFLPYASVVFTFALFEFEKI